MDPYHDLLYRRRPTIGLDVEPSSVAAKQKIGFLSTESDQWGSVTADARWGVVVHSLKRWRPLAHKYADLSEGYIRLAIIQRGAFDDPIKLDMVSRPLTTALSYSALSYEWGETPPVHQITVRDWSEYGKSLREFGDLRLRFYHVMRRHIGPKFYIRHNLFEALRHLRQQRNEVVVWIDAVCINQRSSKEKTEQIAMMSKIYNLAQKVRVWLGTSSLEAEKKQNELAMLFVSELADLKNLRYIIRHKESRSKVIALLQLLRSRWFSRRWVIQEIAVAKAAIVHCGQSKINWEDFAVAVSAFTPILKALRLEPANTDSIELEPQGLGALEAFGANALVNAMTDLLVKGKDGSIQERRQTLEFLVSSLVSFDSRDPRDIVYALLAISREPHVEQHRKMWLRPDYEKSVLQAHTEFVNFCIQTSTTGYPLDIVCRCWAPVHTTLLIEVEKDERRRVETTLPSWIKTLDHSPFGTPDKIFRGRKNADSLVGAEPIYRASSRTQGYADFSSRDSSNDIYKKSTGAVILKETFNGALVVQGLDLGVISELSGRMIPGIVPREALAMAGWTYSLQDQAHQARDVPDRLWRTLIADRDPLGNNQQPNRFTYQKICLHALQEEDVSGDIRIDNIVADKESDDLLVAYLKRVQAVCWNRKVFIGGSSNELFGLCPQEARNGDLVAIIYGCSVPVILREVNAENLPRLGQRLVPKRTLYGEPAAIREAAAKAATRVDTAISDLQSPAADELVEDTLNGQSSLPDTDSDDDSIIESEGYRTAAQSIHSLLSRSSTMATDTSSQDAPSSEGLLQASAVLSRELSHLTERTITASSEDASASSLHDHHLGLPPGLVSDLGDSLLLPGRIDSWRVEAPPAQPRFYRLIGECYVDGKMYGEALDIPDEAKRQKESYFTLV